jgi:glycosyltransferase involved in cell wall biosynthesis
MSVSDSFEVSVIVMTFNRALILRNCLESLRHQTFSRDRFEIVVVDGSKEPAREAVAAFLNSLNINHVIGTNLGIAGNRNRGAQHARGRYLAFIDDDCVARPDWLEKLYDVVSADPLALVGGGVENVFPENAYAVAGQAINEAVTNFFNPPDGDPTFFPGLNFAIEREGFLKTGGCDSSFQLLGGGEDRDFNDRWVAQGGHLVSCPDAVVRHEHRTSFRSFIRQYFSYGRGAWVYRRLKRAAGRSSVVTNPKTHRHLFSELAGPLRRLNPVMRFKTLVLIGIWQIAYYSGILWQAAFETLYPPRA